MKEIKLDKAIINPFNEDINSVYKIIYEHYNWSVLNKHTKEIVCFPTQISAVNWIKNKNN